MNKYFSCLVILLIVVMTDFGVDMASRYNEIEIKLKTEKFFYEQKFLELEKEIRILKQDIYILQCGYEGTENERH